MTDPTLLLSLASLGLAGIAMTSAAFLRGWDRWLELRRIAVKSGAPRRPASMSPEIAELKSRVRRLEAIASGTER